MLKFEEYFATALKPPWSEVWRRARSWSCQRGWWCHNCRIQVAILYHLVSFLPFLPSSCFSWKMGVHNLQYERFLSLFLGGFSNHWTMMKWEKQRVRYLFGHLWKRDQPWLEHVPQVEFVPVAQQLALAPWNLRLASNALLVWLGVMGCWDQQNKGRNRNMSKSKERVLQESILARIEQRLVYLWILHR